MNLKNVLIPTVTPCPFLNLEEIVVTICDNNYNLSKPFIKIKRFYLIFVFSDILIFTSIFYITNNYFIKIELL